VATTHEFSRCQQPIRPHCGNPVTLIVIIPVLGGYPFGLSQSLLGATAFVKTLQSPDAFLMRGGLPCMLRI
jgi:hypothetical protein